MTLRAFGALAFVALSLWVASACSGPTSRPATPPTATSTASPSQAASPTSQPGATVPTPPGFPSDFPVYPGARLTVAGMFTPDGLTSWGMEWQSLDGASKVQAFYIARLRAGDWILLTHTGTVNTSVSTTFRRKSNPLVTGTLTVAASAGVTKITLVLTVP